MEKVLQFSPNITAKIKITSEPLDINEALEFCSDSEAGGNFLFAGTTRGFEKVIKSDATVDTIAIRG
jgi:molybdopterin synthase catalytic subunit